MRARPYSFNASETLLGIETVNRSRSHQFFLSFKASETLLGIETEISKMSKAFGRLSASKPLKPF